MSKIISINPLKRDDGFYRYKMPALETKVESSGNGVKTILSNFNEVCQAINRPPAALVKRIKSLGTKVFESNSKMTAMGRHDAARLQQAIDDFILSTVLCHYCQSPETSCYADSQDNVCLYCAACGKTKPLDDVKEKSELLNYCKTNKLYAPNTRLKMEAEAPPRDAEPSSVPTKQVEQEEVKPLNDNEEPPHIKLIELFRVVLKRSPGDIEHHNEVIGTYVRNLVQQFSFKNNAGVLLLIQALCELFPRRLCEAVNTYRELFHQFCTITDVNLQTVGGDDVRIMELRKAEQKERAMVLLHLGVFFREKSDTDSYFNVDQLVKLIFVFYIWGIIDVKSIERWYMSEAKKETEFTKQIDEKFYPFLKWMGLKSLKEQLEEKK